MINEEFVAEIRTKLHSDNRNLSDLYDCLIAFRDAGMEKDCMYASLEEVRRQSTTEETEDMILELMDFVGGFCSPHSRIYLD